MTYETCIDTHAPQRRRFRGVIVGGLTAVLVGALVLVASDSGLRRVGAATVRPHALNGGIIIVMAATGVTGEGTAGSVTLNSFQFGVKRAGGGTAGGAGSGKAHFSDITITKTVDKASPQFFKSCVAGSHYKTATLVVRKAGAGAPSDVLTISLGTVLVTSVQWSADSTAGDAPTESMTLNFATVKVTYTTPVLG